MTTSSFRTKSSFEIAAAVVAAVRVTMPVLETSELPGRASMRADALAAGAGWPVDWKRTLCARVTSERVSVGQALRVEAEARDRRPPALLSALARACRVDLRREHARLDGLAADTGGGGAEHRGVAEGQRPADASQHSSRRSSHPGPHFISRHPPSSASGVLASYLQSQMTCF